MEDLTNKLKQVMQPRAALVIYENVRGSGSPWAPQAGMKYYLSLHQIVNGELAEGSPITRRQFTKLLQGVVKDVGTTPVYLPEEIIYYSELHETCAWWTPAGVRKIFFSKETEIPSGRAPVPPLLFALTGNNLRVWAMKKNERPTQATRLYRPPFFNCSGNVCLGNSSLPKSRDPLSCSKWTEVFFDSAFTSHGAPSLRGITGEKLWKDLLKGDRKEFPLSCLVDAGLTVRQIF